MGNLPRWCVLQRGSIEVWSQISTTGIEGPKTNVSAEKLWDLPAINLGWLQGSRSHPCGSRWNTQLLFRDLKCENLLLDQGDVIKICGEGWTIQQLFLRPSLPKLFPTNFLSPFPFRPLPYPSPPSDPLFPIPPGWNQFTYASVLVSDFGFATRYPTNKCKLLSTFCGSFAYAAPEILQSQKYDGKSADVWSMWVSARICLPTSLQ